MYVTLIQPDATFLGLFVLVDKCSLWRSLKHEHHHRGTLFKSVADLVGKQILLTLIRRARALLKVEPLQSSDWRSAAEAAVIAQQYLLPLP